MNKIHIIALVVQKGVFLFFRECYHSDNSYYFIIKFDWITNFSFFLTVFFAKTLAAFITHPRFIYNILEPGIYAFFKYGEFWSIFTYLLSVFPRAGNPFQVPI